MQVTLWIYTPDFDSNGQIKPIKNITTARSPYAKHWTDLKSIKTIEKADFPTALTGDQTSALQHWMSFDQIDTLEVEDEDFMNLIKFDGLNNYDKLTWNQIDALQNLNRNMFPNELYWRETEACAGFIVSDKEECHLRTEEMNLVMYTPEECASG